LAWIGLICPTVPSGVQVPGEVRPPHRHANAVAALGEAVHQVTADEAGAARKP
jgi:hypothetical protein